MNTPKHQATATFLALLLTSPLTIASSYGGRPSRVAPQTDFLRSLKRGGGHKGPENNGLGQGPKHDDEHEHWSDLEPDEFCSKVLCGQDAKVCIDELGCFTELETCKDLCQEGDFACYRSCKDDLHICGTNCIVVEEMCVDEGHPDVDECTSCFNATTASNSTYCDNIFEHKPGKHGHKGKDDKNPDEICNKMLCGKDARSCADELGCKSELEVCKGECDRGDHECYRTCKESFELCAATCIADEQTCMDEGHPETYLCVDCFNETAISNSTYCDDVFDWKEHGRDKGHDNHDSGDNLNEIVSGSPRSDGSIMEESSGASASAKHFLSVCVVCAAAYLWI
eukprot:CAMPEP_0196802244 /NCGR_PEP_ID=MMETSP1362-20130617/1884_1 /TAXON_ID=163516 /ORGANISM="Leptocylindrus danicus, Strain CCMP1856" /LENGTH=339 /DNA_ID=CAMNT_0042173483 /DNA_START=41 /DNA_END=1060 /DNA_ORIENTATION=+